MEPAQPLPLDRLLAELHAARAKVAKERGGRDAREGSLARTRLLDALEAYVDGLLAAGHPVPYRVRDELFMHRRLALLERAWRR